MRCGADGLNAGLWSPGDGEEKHRKDVCQCWRSRGWHRLQLLFDLCWSNDGILMIVRLSRSATMKSGSRRLGAPDLRSQLTTISYALPSKSIITSIFHNYRIYAFHLYQRLLFQYAGFGLHSHPCATYLGERQENYIQHTPARSSRQRLFPHTKTVQEFMAGLK